MSLAVLRAVPQRGPPSILVREARAGDDDALVRLAACCPMRGEIDLCIDRAPSFFAPLLAAGSPFRVAVAERAGEVAGCVALSERPSWLGGARRTIVYASDLRVHPGLRGTGATPALIEWLRARAREIGGDEQPVVLTVLAGNAPMERLARGENGLPRLERFATMRNFAIPVLRRRASDEGAAVSEAQPHELDEMAALWARVAPQRQCAPALDAREIARFAIAAPGLSLEDYLLARDARGRLRGFLAVWDQHAIKRLRVLRWSPRLRLARALLNLLSPLTGLSRLPRAGQPLHAPGVLHLCVPGDDPIALRSLLLAALARLRGTSAHLLNLGLDVRDPLTAALRGLWAQPTDFHARITAPSGSWLGTALDDLPFHLDVPLA